MGGIHVLSDLLMHRSVCRKTTGKYEVLFNALKQCEFNRNAERNGVHCHDCFEICYVKAGRGVFCSNGKEVPIESGCVFLGVPLVSHEIMLKDSEKLQISYLSFSIHTLERKSADTPEDRMIENFLREQNGVAYNQSHIGVYPEMLERYFLLGGVYAAESLTFSMIMDMLKSLSGEKPVLEDQAASVKQRVDRYIYQNMSRKITIPELCNCSGLSERALFYFFQNHLGVTPGQYVQQMKLSASVGFLKMGIPVKSIAVQFGFADASAYCRSFKKVYGNSPFRFSKSVESEEI